MVMVFVGDQSVAQSRAPWAFPQWPRSARPSFRCAVHSAAFLRDKLFPECTWPRLPVASYAGGIHHTSVLPVPSPPATAPAWATRTRSARKGGVAAGANGNPGLIPLKPADALGPSINGDRGDASRRADPPCIDSARHPDGPPRWGPGWSQAPNP